MWPPVPALEMWSVSPAVSVMSSPALASPLAPTVNEIAPARAVLASPVENTHEPVLPLLDVPESVTEERVRAASEAGNLFMVAATLRPETMYGQTNCWVKPDMAYVACRLGYVYVYVCRSVGQ